MYLQLPNNYDNLVILKSGFSTLGAISYDFLHNNILSKEKNVWDNICYDFKQTTRNNSKTFLVYREPYDRIVSLYKDIISDENNHPGCSWLFSINGKRLPDNEIFNHFITKLCKEKLYNVDAHTKSLVNLFSLEELNSINIIVKMNDLTRFIQEELKYDMSRYIKRNESKQNIDVSEFEKYRDEIREFYNADYEWIEQNKDKIWKSKEH